MQLVIILFGILSVVSCDNNKDGLSGDHDTKDIIDIADTSEPDADAAPEDINNEEIEEIEETEEDTYSVWTDTNLH